MDELSSKKLVVLVKSNIGDRLKKDCYRVKIVMLASWFDSSYLNLKIRFMFPYYSYNLSYCSNFENLR